jgi:type III restriction enzyme
MYERLEEMQSEHPDPAMRTVYTDKLPLPRLKTIVRKSLERKNTDRATEAMKQAFLRGLNVLGREEATFVRFVMKEKSQHVLSTRERQADSVSAAELHGIKTYFWTELTRPNLSDEQVEFFDEVSEQDSTYKKWEVRNRLCFKTPLSAVIADSSNESKFIKELIAPNNLPLIEAWIKNTATRFYDIEYAWRKREHQVRGWFSPDFFIKLKQPIVLVAEIKDDEELKEPNPENFAKNKYALEHFARVNAYLIEDGSPLQYQFNFLIPEHFGVFFQQLREGRIWGYQSPLDLLLENE